MDSMIDSKRTRNHIFKKLISFLLCMVMLLSSMPSLAAGEEAFFNAELVDMSSVGWATTYASVNSGTVSMVETAPSGDALYQIDVSGIAGSVDLGNLSADFSVSAYIGEADDAASARLQFYTSNNYDNTADRISSASLARGSEAPGSAQTLSTSRGIPAGTRFIFVLLEGESSAGSNTVSFSNVSLAIGDASVPSISADYASDWTNQDVVVSVTAGDSQSGVKAIYRDGASVYDGPADETTYQYTLSANGTSSLYAVDYAAKQSETLTVNVTNIDKNAPDAPGMTLSEAWSKDPLTLTLTSAAAPAGESPQTIEYRLGGGSFSSYSSPVTISAEGETAVTARVVDAAGNSSSTVTKTARIDSTAPVIETVESDGPSSSESVITVTFTDPLSGISERRYAQGEYTAAEFAQIGFGTAIADGASITVSAGNTYTIFAKDAVGNTAVKSVSVNAYPSVGTIPGQTLSEDGADTVNVSVSDVETSLGDLAITAVSNNTLLLPDPVVTRGAGSISLALAPVLDGYGTATVTLTVTDADGKSTVRTFLVTVNSENDLPVASNDEATTTEDGGSITINVLANDTDADHANGTLRVNGVSTPAHGTASISGDGRSILYTPNANFNGAEIFTYTVKDPLNGVSGAAFITVNVTGQNDGPVAGNDSLSINEDESTLIDVLSTDTDTDSGTAEGETLAIETVSAVRDSGGVERGLAEIEANKIRYTPPLNWSGSVSFTYTITDKGGLTAQAAVSVTVKAVNDLPVFTGLNSPYAYTEDCAEQTITFNISDVETASPSSLMLQVASLNENLIPASSLKLGGLDDDDPAVSLSFTPNPNAHGAAVISLRLGDGVGVKTATVTMDIASVNDAPVAGSDAFTYTEDTPLEIPVEDLLANDTDIDGNTLSVAEIVTPPLRGTLAPKEGDTSVYVYTPVADDDGSATFTYRVSDGTGEPNGTATGTVTLSGTAVNDIPVLSLTSDSLEVEEDGVLSDISFTIGDNETTADNLIVTAGSSDESKVSPQGLAVTNHGDGTCSLSITPAKNAFTAENAPIAITVTVSDGEQMVNEQISLIIHAVPDVPIAVDDYIGLANGSAAFNPLANDFDVDGYGLTITEIGTPAHGTITPSGNTLTYQSSDGTAMADSFSYTVSNGSMTATATITVAPAGAFPPVIYAVANQFIEEDRVGGTGPITFTAFDPDSVDRPTVTATSGNASLIPNDAEHIQIANGAGNTYTIAVIPAADAYGSTTITLHAVDASGRTADRTFTVTVYPVNDAPRPTDDFATTSEDAILLFNVGTESLSVDEGQEVVNLLLNDSDPETAKSALRVVGLALDTTTAGGTLQRQANAYAYTPRANYHGTVQFTYTLTDGEASSTASVTLTINPVNDAPYFRSSYPIYYGKPAVGETRVINVSDLLARAADADGDTLYFDSIVTGSIYGTTEYDAGAGTITYTATSAENDTFVFKIRDREEAADPEALTVQREVNISTGGGGGTLWAENVRYDVEEDCAPFLIRIPFVFNGDTATLGASYTQPLKGAITAEPVFVGGNEVQLEYTPTANANGSEDITVTITGTAGGEQKTVSVHAYIQILPVNDAPVFTYPSDDTLLLSVPEDTTLDMLQDIAFSDVDSTGLICSVFAVNADPAHPALLSSGITADRDDDMGNTVGLLLAPVADAHGDAIVRMVVSDGMLTATRDITLSVTPVNDAPLAPDLEFTVQEDSLNNALLVLSPNSDVDSDASGLSFVLPTALDAGKGALTMSEGSVVLTDGAISYTPYAGYTESYSFSYQLDDGEAANARSAVGTITIHITPVNYPPAIVGLATEFSVLEDQNWSQAFTTEDPDGDEVTVSAAYTPSAQFPAYTVEGGPGIAVTKAVDHWLLTALPAANVYHTVNQYQSVTITAADSEGASVQQVVKLTVVPQNDLPQATGDTGSTPEDTPVTLSVLGNDSDLEDGTLRIVQVGATTQGGTVINNSNTLTYTPPANYFSDGTPLRPHDRFTYTVTDSAGARATAQVEISITPVNDAPQAAADAVTTAEDTEKTVDVLVNDSDMEDAKALLTISLPSPSSAQGGALALTGDSRQVRYMPALNFTGTDTFAYTLLDQDGGSSAGQVTVTVTPDNDAPLIENKVIDNAGVWVLNEDEPTGFRFDVSDAETAAVNLIVELTSGDQSLIDDNKILLSGSGKEKTAHIIPQPNKYSPEGTTGTITATVSDGIKQTTYVFDVQIQSVNDAPVLAAPAIVTSEDTQRSGKVTATDADGDTLAFTQAAGEGPDHGSVVFNADGSYTYTPAANYNGADYFTVQVNDGQGAANSIVTARVEITVQPVNDAPLADAETATTLEDTAVDINALEGDTDADGDTLTITRFDLLNHGTAAVVTEGEHTGWVRFTPGADWNGTEEFTYTISDGNGGTATGNVTVTVTAQNDQPAPVHNNVTTDENTPVYLDVLSDDDADLTVGTDRTDFLIIDGSVTKLNGTDPDIGTWEIVAKDATYKNDRILFTPDANWTSKVSQSVTLTYLAQDSAGLEAAGTVKVTVTPVNDAPVITKSFVSPVEINEDAATGALEFTVTDEEDDDDVLVVTAASSNTTLLPGGNSIITNPTEGDASLRTVTATPAADKNGSSTVTLTVKDASNAPALTTFVLQVAPVNDAPYDPLTTGGKGNDTAAVDEDGSIAIDVLVNDDIDLTDTDSMEELTVTGIVPGQEPAHGTATPNADGTITYTPAANYFGTDSFRYAMADKAGETGTFTVAVTVNSVNDAPVIQKTFVNSDQPVTILEDGTTDPLTFRVTDVDHTYDLLTVTATSGTPAVVPNSAVNLQLTGPDVNGDCSLIVKPALDQNGDNITITLLAEDALGEPAQATIVLNVTPVQDAPVSGEDIFTVTEDTSTLLDVLANDDVDADTNDEELTLVSVDPIDGVTHGSITIENNQVRYIPALNSNVQDRFTYTMRDANNAQATSTVVVNITPVNDRPVITWNNGDLTYEENKAGTKTFTVTDVDNEDGALSVSLSAIKPFLVKTHAIQKSSEEVEESGRTLSIETGRWNGNTMVTLTASDGSLTGAATFKLTVTSVNDAPDAVDDAFTKSEDVQGDAQLLNVLGNDTDADIETSIAGDEISIVSATQPTSATITLVQEGGINKKLRFAPEPDWNGVAIFAYTITDESGVEDTATVTVTVSAVNDAPAAENDSAAADEDTVVYINALLNDSDVENDTLTITGTAGVEHGAAAVVTEEGEHYGWIKFTPTANWNGTESFTYTVNDGHGGTDTATVTVTLAAVNDAPVAANDSASTNEDIAVNISVLTNDSDVENNMLTIDPGGFTEAEDAGGTVRGTVALNGSLVRFTPTSADWFGSVTFDYTISDGNGGTDTATVTLTVNAVNDAPAAENDSAAAEEDTVVYINALSNDSDVENDTLTITGTAAVENGTATVVTEAGEHYGWIRFAPSANWNGLEEFTYTVSDGHTGTDTATVAVTLTPVNDAPVAANDSISTGEDTAVDINVLLNDSDVENNTLTIDPAGFTEAKDAGDTVRGTVARSGNIVRFTPTSLDWHGTVTFDYTVSDGNGGTDTATVTVTVTPVNDAPVAGNDNAPTAEDTAVYINVLANDSDVEGDTLTVSNTFEGLNYGTAAVVAEAGEHYGWVRFTPEADWSGMEEFTYTVGDGHTGTDTATVTVTVTPVNDAPLAVNDSASVGEAAAVDIDVLANDVDTENDTLAVDAAGFSQARDAGGILRGTVAIHEGLVRFTPSDPDWNGTATFTYTVTDGNGGTDTATVTVTVDAENDAPNPPVLLTPVTGSYYKDGQTVSVTWSPATDPDGDAITYALYFFDGSAWALLEDGLTATSYSHALTDTGLTTDTVRYRVAAYDPSAASAEDTGDAFIIDNAAPAGVTVERTVNGAPAAMETWSNVNQAALRVLNGTDLLPFGYDYRLAGETEWIDVPVGGQISFASETSATVELRAIDALENTYTATFTVLIDRIAPPQPQILRSTEESNVKSVVITLELAEDLGGSGNESVKLPDGQTLLVASNPVIAWTATKNGTFDCIIRDKAGNTTTVPVTISNIKKQTSGGSSATPTPTPEIVEIPDEVSPTPAPAAQAASPTAAPTAAPAKTPTFTFSPDGKTGLGAGKTPGPTQTPAAPDADAPQNTEPTAIEPTPGIGMELASVFGTFQQDIATIRSNVVLLLEKSPTLKATTSAGCGLLLLLLLFLLLRPVRIEYNGTRKKGDKEYRRVIRRFAHVPRKEETLTLELKHKPDTVDMEAITVQFRRLFTRRMRERNVQLTWEGKQIAQFNVEKDQKGRWSVTIRR